MREAELYELSPDVVLSEQKALLSRVKTVAQAAEIAREWQVAFPAGSLALRDLKRMAGLYGQLPMGEAGQRAEGARGLVVRVLALLAAMIAQARDE